MLGQEEYEKQLSSWHMQFEVIKNREIIVGQFIAEKC